MPLLSPTDKPLVPQPGKLLRERGLLPVLAVMLLLTPLLPAPLQSIRWHGAQTLGVEAGTLLLAALVFSRKWADDAAGRLVQRLRFPPFFCFSLLLLWGAFSCATAAGKAFAVQGLLQFSGGFFIMLLVAAQVQTQPRLLFVLNALLGAASLVALTGLAQLGSGELPLATGCLDDHQLFGAFMMLPIPLGLALSLGAGSQGQRLGSQAALLVCVLGLAESQHRSAWLATVVALAVFGGLVLFRGAAASAARQQINFRPRRWRLALVPAALAVLVLLGIGLGSPDKDRLFARLTSVQGAAQNRDSSLEWRRSVWSRTRRMIADKPLLGWGLGSFPAQHKKFTQTGHPADVVRRQGPSIEDEAHNSYLQLWAEMGIVGLLLWLGAMGSFLVLGTRAVKGLRHGGLAQWVLIGCLSALAGQMVDALANPAWQFGHIMLPLWVILGIIGAVVSPAEGTEAAGRRRGAASLHVLRAVIGTCLSAALLWVLYQTAFALPAPHL